MVETKRRVFLVHDLNVMQSIIHMRFQHRSIPSYHSFSIARVYVLSIEEHSPSSRADTSRLPSKIYRLKQPFYLPSPLKTLSSRFPSLNAKSESSISLFAALMYLRNADDISTTCLRWSSVTSGTAGSSPSLPVLLCLESYTASATAVWNAIISH